jgi:hypothetical protein
LDKLLLITGFKTEQKRLIKSKLRNLSDQAVDLLKRIILEGSFGFRSHDLDKWITTSGLWEVNHLRELESQRFIIDRLESGGTRTLHFKELNEDYRTYLVELLF